MSPPKVWIITKKQAKYLYFMMLCHFGRKMVSLLSSVWASWYKHKHACWKVSFSSLTICLYLQLTQNYASFSKSFHNKLKTNPKYLNHRVNRRCDDLLEVLLHYEQDMFHDRMRKEIIMSPSDASEKVEGTKRHSHGAQIPNSSIQVTTHILCTYTNMYAINVNNACSTVHRKVERDTGRS